MGRLGRFGEAELELQPRPGSFPLLSVVAGWEIVFFSFSSWSSLPTSRQHSREHDYPDYWWCLWERRWEPKRKARVEKKDGRRRGRGIRESGERRGKSRGGKESFKRDQAGTPGFEPPTLSWASVTWANPLDFLDWASVFFFSCIIKRSWSQHLIQFQL